MHNIEKLFSIYKLFSLYIFITYILYLFTNENHKKLYEIANTKKALLLHM